MKKFLVLVLLFVVAAVVILKLRAPTEIASAPQSPAPEGVTTSAPVTPTTPALEGASVAVSAAPSMPSAPSAQPDPAFRALEARFRESLREGLKNMPTRASLKKMTEEQAHHAPPYLNVAGEILGNVAEAIKKDPRLVPAALEFYRDCAASGEFPTAVRALCLADLRKRGPDKEAHVPGVPSQVESLAGQLKF